jgi:hypothetical protein
VAPGHILGDTAPVPMRRSRGWCSLPARPVILTLRARLQVLRTGYEHGGDDVAEPSAVTFMRRREPSHRRARPHHAVLVGEHDCLHAVSEPQLCQYACNVSLDRCRTQKQLRRDLGVAEALGHEPKDLRLPVG